MAVFRSNKGMETVCSRAGGLVNFGGGVEHGLCSSRVQATDSKRSATVRRARPWLWPRWRSGICGAATVIDRSRRLIDGAQRLIKDGRAAV